MAHEQYQGGCLCGAVAFTYSGPLRPIVACHCRQCQKTSGHYVAATQGYWDKVQFQRQDGLAWYGSSAIAERGFCQQCGSSLFWRRYDNTKISIMAGALDPPTGLRLVGHIHAEAKSDYYQLNDGLPQFQQDELPSRFPTPSDGSTEFA